MEVTLENIFQLFTASEQQRLAQQERYEQMRLEDLAERKRDAAERKREEAERRIADELERKQMSAERDKELKKISRDLSKKIAELGDVLGMYAEAQVKERIRELFAERGIVCDGMTIHYEKGTADDELMYEIDILLYDTDYVIAIEVKHRLKNSHIDEHLERLEKCVIKPPKGAEGKKILGAVATMIVSNETEAYARNCGLYVIKPSGKSVKIANPPNFKARAWQAAG